MLQKMGKQLIKKPKEHTTKKILFNHKTKFFSTTKQKHTNHHIRWDGSRTAVKRRKEEDAFVVLSTDGVHSHKTFSLTLQQMTDLKVLHWVWHNGAVKKGGFFQLTCTWTGSQGGVPNSPIPNLPTMTQIAYSHFAYTLSCFAHKSSHFVYSKFQCWL